MNLYLHILSLNIDPQITQEEINVIWKEFILKDNHKLEYWQFIRHFGYSRKSGAFKNARLAPPKRGDNDVNLTSKNHGRDNMIIRGSVQAKVCIYSGIAAGNCFLKPTRFNYNVKLCDMPFKNSIYFTVV